MIQFHESITDDDVADGTYHRCLSTCFEVLIDSTEKSLCAQIHKSSSSCCSRRIKRDPHLKENEYHSSTNYQSRNVPVVSIGFLESGFHFVTLVVAPVGMASCIKNCVATGSNPLTVFPVSELPKYFFFLQ